MRQVDIVVPCYKYGRFLADCVRSALQQRGVQVKVLIIDDASPDDTPDVAAPLVAGDSRVAYRRHRENRGHIATYNEGIAWTTGDYFLLLSADDALTPGSLQRAVAVMEAHQEVSFVYGPVIHLQAHEPAKPPASAAIDVSVIDGEDFVATMCETGLNPVPAPSAVVRGPLQREAGGYREALTHTGDQEMWLRLAAHGAVGYVNTVQAFYRQHAGAMHHEYERSLRYLEQRRAAFDMFFDGYGHRLTRTAILSDTVRRRIAIEAFWHASRAFDRGDAPECRRSLDFALATHASVKALPSWKRLAIKRFLGPRLWSTVASVTGRPAAAPAQAQSGSYDR